jgi:hypothetical protein
MNTSRLAPSWFTPSWFAQSWFAPISHFAEGGRGVNFQFPLWGNGYVFWNDPTTLISNHLGETTLILNNLGAKQLGVNRLGGKTTGYQTNKKWIGYIHLFIKGQQLREVWNIPQSSGSWQNIESQSASRQIVLICSRQNMNLDGKKKLKYLIDTD